MLRRYKCCGSSSFKVVGDGVCCLREVGGVSLLPGSVFYHLFLLGMGGGGGSGFKYHCFLGVDGTGSGIDVTRRHTV